MDQPRRTLYRHARVDTPADPEASAVLVVGDRIAWVGRDADADPDTADDVVDFAGAWLAPAFVDAHVHSTATGLALTGLDLAGASSLGDALDRLARYAAANPAAVVMGTGWDETRWPERRPPTGAEVGRAAPDRLVYLARIDVHSAVVSPELLAACAGVERADGFRPDGWLRRDAHHVVRTAAFDLVTPEQRLAAQRATRARAAELGIGCLHELAGPAISGADDCSGLLRLAADEPGPTVLAYWGELDGVDAATRLRTLGAAGDLFVDGAIGSRTACLSTDYADDPGNAGALYHDVDAVARHVAACTLAGMQAGFHAIGDAAIEMVCDGFRLAAERVGLDRLRAARHRIEHAEMSSAAVIEALARYGVVASVQPVFDALWGGAAGMYAERLGADRSATLNPFAAMAAAGLPLALGSDAPVTPLGPWGAVRAAVAHHQPAHALGARAAFDAHTRGGWFAARVDGAGVLVPGAPAYLAGWDAGPLDAGSRLPDVAGAEPACVLTVAAGHRVFDSTG